MLSQWLSAVFSHPDLLGALIIAGKTALIYLFLIFGLRLLGKRELGQMSVYDLVLIIIIANAVQNAMLGNDNTLVGGLVAALTILLLNRVFTWFIVRHPKFNNFMLGVPVLIVRDGKLLKKPMEREGVTREHVLAAMREHGIAELEKVQIAVLEVDGSISIVAEDAQVHRTRRRFKGLRVT
jgi:Predicted membrane protein